MLPLAHMYLTCSPDILVEDQLLGPLVTLDADQTSGSGDYPEQPYILRRKAYWSL